MGTEAMLALIDEVGRALIGPPATRTPLTVAREVTQTFGPSPSPSLEQPRVPGHETS